MERPFDLVIRNGTIFDGTGAPSFRADLAIRDGIIVKLGQVTGSALDEFDAAGLLVTPGFVDIHTHYDAQVTWANRLAPSTAHGVTTVVIGNCGVGFAPCRPQDQDSLIRLMEGVEDIPGVVMAEGIPWKWETFPEFLDFLESRQFDADVGAYLPHAPLRVYAMGQRGLDREPANAADLQRMVDLASEAMQAGALGIATSRSLNHRSSDHHLLPGVSAAEGELKAISVGIKRSGSGVLQLIADFDEPESDFAMLRRVGEDTGLPIMFSLMQMPGAPTRWRTLLGLLEAANDDGVHMKAQVFPRPVGSIAGLDLHYNFFSFSPAYAKIADLPLAERLAVMRNPDVRRQITDQYPTVTIEEPASGAFSSLDSFYLMGGEPDYEPDPANSVGARARAAGMRPVDLAYDLLVENDGSNVFYAPVLNYVDGNLDAVGTMLRHDHTLVGLGDGGAHVGIICDASGQTSMLMRWAGEGNGRMPIEKVVQALTSNNARAVNLLDRGLIAEGYRADINIIDFAALKLHRPEMIHDLPLGGGRLIQRADGYRMTIVAGQVTYSDGEHTGLLPGRLVRGTREEPRRDHAAVRESAIA